MVSQVGDHLLTLATGSTRAAFSSLHLLSFSPCQLPNIEWSSAVHRLVCLVHQVSCLILGFLLLLARRSQTAPIRRQPVLLILASTLDHRLIIRASRPLLFRFDHPTLLTWTSHILLIFRFDDHRVD